ncbi:MAG: 2-phospho-L-lactate transferase [Actinomycetota bacterium]
MSIVALAGGVGAAKLLRGLVRAIDPEEITVIGNTGDDAVFHGLHVSPDLDIVTYTLAGLVDEERGWGLRSDTTAALEQMARLTIDAWFRLGDRDLGTHLARTTWLNEGASLSEVTDRIRSALGVKVRILPMSDDPIRTKIVTAGGILRDFQEYFVRLRHREQVAAVFFQGISEAAPAPGVLEALAIADRVIVCPSNPVVSIGPILAVPGLREVLRSRRRDVFAISPIIEGAALKGPAVELLEATGAEPSASGVAALYADFCGAFILDRRDADQRAKVEALGMRAILLETIMQTPEVAEVLAKELLAL